MILVAYYNLPEVAKFAIIAAFTYKIMTFLLKEKDDRWWIVEWGDQLSLLCGATDIFYAGKIREVLPQNSMKAGGADRNRTRTTDEKINMQ